MQKKNELSRRDFGGRLAALAALAAGAAATSTHAESAAQSPGSTHDMSMAPPHWTGNEQIAFLIYPGFTALDMVGPHYMLSSLMGATVHVVAKTTESVRSDAGLVFTPSATFETCPRDLDILCVPGGAQGTVAAMRDEDTLQFVRDRGARAKYVTSVCTGSLVLAAAGLLNGYKATSHWLARASLAKFGAIPTEGRVVRDRNRITGAGVTAGIDFGLSLVRDARDRDYAEAVQLLAEYDPQPPLDSGSPAKAAPHIRSMMEGMLASFLTDVESLAPRDAKPPVK